MCDTGIALLAYMDGINDSPTLSGVVLAVTSAAASAVFKVCIFNPAFALMKILFAKGDVSKNGRAECESGPGGRVLFGAGHNERSSSLASGARALPFRLGICSLA